MALDIESVRERTAGRTVVWLESTPSTMIEAGRMAVEGCPSGTVVGAEEQTSGQGRYGRHWHSARESGLYLTVVLRPKVAADSLPVITMALGLAAAEAITTVCGVACDLRWPNDVLIGDKKCAGILVQMHDAALLAGIGINVNHARMPEDLNAISTSLRMASGKDQSRENLLIELLESIDRHVELLVNGGKQPILELFARASSYVSGRRVTVEQNGQTLLGTTSGLDESGFLRLTGDDGRKCLILAGGVRPV